MGARSATRMDTGTDAEKGAHMGGCTDVPMTAGERFRSLGTKPRVLPSILSADFAALAASFAPLEAAGAEILHLDVMDGHFVENITFGPPLVRCVRAASRAFLDVHLMITEPLRYLEPFAKAGADLCCVHAEVPVEPEACAAEAARLGIALGVAVRPSTELDPVIERWARHVALVLVMSVEPGFGGQGFMPAAFDRLRRAREICDCQGVAPILEVDGGIGVGNAAEVVAAGAQWLVAGNAVFKAPDPVAAWRDVSLRASVRHAGP
jgi:ribulose-phosphate 3-epimerase